MYFNIFLRVAGDRHSRKTKNQDTRPDPRRGFTLLEVMLAMTILAIALLAIYQSQRQSMAMAARANFLTDAALLAQGRMAQVDAANMLELSSSRGDFGADYPQYRWELVVMDTEIPFLKRIELTVKNSAPSPESYQLLLYKMFRF